MKKMMRMMVVLGMAISLPLIARVVSANQDNSQENVGPDSKQEETGKGKFIDKMAEKLQLSDGQKTKLQDLMKSEGEQRKQVMEKMKQQLKDLGQLVKSSAGDTDLTAKLDELTQSKQAMQDIEKDQTIKARQILTPMQQAKFTLGMAMMKMKGMEKWKDKMKDKGNGKDDKGEDNDKK